MTRPVKFAGAALLALLCSMADARLTRINVLTHEIVSRIEPGAPAYTILRGRYAGELDPADPHNRIITDLAGASRLANGRVGYEATFEIALPIDPRRASGFLMYDVPNRGNGTVAADPDGHVRVVSGWQGDIAPQAGVQTLTAPVATGPGGTSLTAPVLQRFTDMPVGATSIAIVGGIGRPTPRPLPVSLDTRQSLLTRQGSAGARLITIPSADWAFADCRTAPFPGIPDPTQLCVRGGFDPANAYTVTYEGKDPKVLGIGFAAVRDLNTFLRNAQADDAGTPNPVAGIIKWSIITGTSQSGNFVRSLISLGFNAGEDGRRVFDGANPNIAARQVPLNIRFGLPGGAANPFELGSEGNLWWTRYNDKARGRGTSSLLDRCHRDRTCPRIVETFGAAEFWGLRMSPNLVGTSAKSDLPLPQNVRRYYFPSVTHGGSYSGGFPMAGDTFAFPGAPRCTLPGNPNPSSDTRRAILKALAEWVSTGKAPPPSRYPTLMAGDLVPANSRAMGWPAIPGVPKPDGKLNTLPDYHVSPRFNYRDLSGVATRLPPIVRQMIPQLVPRVNADGNETAGIPSVQLLVPIGTYTGWNELSSGYGKGGGCGFAGGFVPFARTEAERRAKGDSRPSLEARYHDHEGFVTRIRAAVAQQVGQGWLLPDDGIRIVSQAQASEVLR
ncbi:MAG: alpha/beta hydrolase domain-containing protein [Sphingomicrobium sp.]